MTRTILSIHFILWCCSAWELKTDDSFVVVGGDCAATGAESLAALLTSKPLADIQVRVDVPVKETVTLRDDRQWHALGYTSDAVANDTTAKKNQTDCDSVCLELALNTDALLLAHAQQPGQLEVTVAHWSSSTAASFDMVMRITAFRSTVLAQVAVLVSEELSERDELLGPAFTFVLPETSSTLVWLTVWMENIPEQDMHRISVWQLQPTEEAWIPSVDFHSKAIECGAKHDVVQLLLLSDSVYSAETAAGVKDRTDCINRAISRTATRMIRPDALSVAVPLSWPAWKLDASTIFWPDAELTTRNALTGTPYVWRSLTAFTVSRRYAFEDKMLTGTRWSVEVCVCRPWSCDLRGMQCHPDVLVPAIYVFHDVATHRSCLNTTCYFLDNRYVVLQGAVDFIGVGGDNGAVYGINNATQTANNTRFLSQMLEALPRSIGEAASVLFDDHISCSRNTAAGMEEPSFFVDKKSSDWLEVVLDPCNALV